MFASLKLAQLKECYQVWQANYNKVNGTALVEMKQWFGGCYKDAVPYLGTLLDFQEHEKTMKGTAKELDSGKMVGRTSAKKAQCWNKYGARSSLVMSLM
ncbi:hypothetical protein FRX31_015000 [Thalictrum thalictroides]|uniref:Uncharacterized protein n=1 Tax=Thalictrum thalictroides TaxID=46969 RepID=A0A7J6WH60_THATH|nr:hypothetical protein FRX31_015000 [Thalictrum thalictroides]